METELAAGGRLDNGVTVEVDQPLDLGGETPDAGPVQADGVGHPLLRHRRPAGLIEGPQEPGDHLGVEAQPRQGSADLIDCQDAVDRVDGASGRPG